MYMLPVLPLVFTYIQRFAARSPPVSILLNIFYENAAKRAHLPGGLSTSLRVADFGSSMRTCVDLVIVNHVIGDNRT